MTPTPPARLGARPAADEAVKGSRFLERLPDAARARLTAMYLATFAPRALDLPMESATRRLEQLIRSYDPCISCATHFLDLSVEQTR